LVILRINLILDTENAGTKSGSVAVNGIIAITTSIADESRNIEADCVIISNQQNL
jgi:hypothetical protein